MYFVIDSGARHGISKSSGWRETCHSGTACEGSVGDSSPSCGSQRDPSRHYVGRTEDVDERLRWHNEGPCGYTVAHRPWLPVVVLEFPTETAA